MCTVRKRNHFHSVRQNWAAWTGYSLPRQDRELQTAAKTFFSATTFPWSCLWIVSLHVFFPPLSGCWVCSEICWEKHGGLVLPLLLMLQRGRTVQIILEQEMWHGRRENHKQFCRNVTWKHFNNSFGFYYLSKNLNKQNLIIWLTEKSDFCKTQSQALVILAATPSACWLRRHWMREAEGYVWKGNQFFTGSSLHSGRPQTEKSWLPFR